MSSGAVDTKTVEMRFDNSDFEKNAKQSMSTLERLKHALKLDGASAGLREVERASKKLDFKDVRNGVDDAGKRFSILENIAIGALRRIGEHAADAGLRIAKSLTVDQVAAGWNKYEEKTLICNIMCCINTSIIIINRLRNIKSNTNNKWKCRCSSINMGCSF